MTLEQELIETFCDNFVAYYRSHSCHLNITGRNFYSDHKLLNKIYDDLQDEIDTLGEIIRTIDVKVPETIREILDTADLQEETTIGFADELLQITMDALVHLIESYREIEELADGPEYEHISNHAQDRVLSLEKFVWMLRSTLE